MMMTLFFILIAVVFAWTLSGIILYKYPPDNYYYYMNIYTSQKRFNRVSEEKKKQRGKKHD